MYDIFLRNTKIIASIWNKSNPKINCTQLVSNNDFAIVEYQRVSQVTWRFLNLGMKK